MELSELCGRTIGDGRYFIEAPIRMGGMGAVYRGTQVSLSRSVAVKVLSEPLAGDPEFMARFTREARILATFQHPHIVTVIDFGREGDLNYIVMVYIAGPSGKPTSLRDFMSAGKMNPDKICEFMLQACSALSYAHRQGIIHRDVKPSNFLIDGDLNVHLADFGIAGAKARADGLELTVSDQVLGSFKYMSPEQRADPTKVDARSDLYSLGIVFYEMLTGRLPEGRFEMPSEIRKDIDPRVDRIIDQALQRNPDKRFRSADEMAQAIRSVIATQVERKPQPGVASRPESQPGLPDAEALNALNKAWKLASSGLPEQGLPLVQPLLGDPRSRDYAIFTLAFCFQQMGDLPTAVYLYEPVIQRNTDKTQWLTVYKTCKQLHQAKIEEARARKVGLWRLVFAFLLLMAAAAVFSPFFVKEIQEIVEMVTETEWATIQNYVMLGGCAISLAVLLVVGSWVLKRRRYRKHLRSVRGGNFQDRRHRECWCCQLRYRKNLKTCPYCNAPRTIPREIQEARKKKGQETAAAKPAAPPPEPRQPAAGGCLPGEAAGPRRVAGTTPSPPVAAKAPTGVLCPDEKMTIASKGRPAPQPVAPSAAPCFTLSDRIVSVGRSRDCDFHLDHPMVSRRHARISPAEGGYLIEDLGSTNGIYVRGKRIDEKQVLEVGDDVGIGPYLLAYDGIALRSMETKNGTEILVRELGKEVIDRATRKPLFILKNIDLAIEAGEFVGLMGSSGCGKSTFMDTVNGRRPSTHGHVYYNGQNLYQRFESLKSGIGYVPQEVIFHDNLPLEKAQRYASNLRLSADILPEEVDQNIGRVLEIVGLAGRRKTVIRNLSGGQKKRVSIAMELLSRPKILFLDEVTSGLDLGTEKQMMELFRRLANEGVTVVCISHFVDSLDVCDTVAYFHQGRLAFYGPPAALRAFFGIGKISDIYAMEKENPSVNWEARFRNSNEYQEYVAKRGAALAQPIEQLPAEQGQPTVPLWRFSEFRRQFGILTRRYWNCVTSDKMNLFVLLLAPVIAFLICVLTGSIGAPEKPIGLGDFAQYRNDPALKGNFQDFPGFVQEKNSLIARKQSILCFGSILTVFFLALFGSIREIVKELSIYRHERFTNLQILPYLASKILLLAVIGAIQTLIIILILNHIGGLKAGPLWRQFAVLFPVGICGLLIGLVISAAVATSDLAVQLMIGVVIPQLLFAGALVPIKGVATYIAKVLIVCYWTYGSMIGMLSVDVQKMLNPDTPAGGGGWVGDALFLPLHAVAYGLLLIAFMMRKDGLRFPAVIRQMVNCTLGVVRALRSRKPTAA
jgi:ABC-type multidrug transport system ATPase subunit